MTIKRAELNALLATLERALGKGFSEALKGMTTGIQFATLTRAVRSGDLDKIMHAAGMRAGSWNHLTEQIRTAYIEGGSFTIASEVPARFGMVFDISNPRAEKWLRFNSSRLITRINKEQRYAIQLVLKDGMRLGKNPRSMGLDIVGRMGKGGIRTGGIIGLNVPQTRAVMNMRTDLRNLDINYFTRARRDRRFDKVVHRAIKTGKPLSTASVSRLTSRYSDRLKELRGATIGRTEALASLNAASHESMEQVIGEGLAPKKAIKRIWHHGGYSKDERKGHRAMGKELQERDMDEAFINPYTNQSMMYPGAGVASEVINCRCWVEHKVDFVQAATGEEPPALPGLKKTQTKPKPKAKPKPKPKKKVSLKTLNLPDMYGGQATGIVKPVIHKPWMNKGRKAGAFDTPRLSRLATSLDDPKQLHRTTKKAHYSHDMQGINMEGSLGWGSINGYRGKNVLRHEWGHFLDHQIGKLRGFEIAKHPLFNKLVKLAGGKNKGFGFISSRAKPLEKLFRDGKKLQQLGHRIWNKTKPSKSPTHIYDHDMIDEAWAARKMQLARRFTSNEAVDVARETARITLKTLGDEGNLIAKVYLQMKKQNIFVGPWNELLFADAAVANDLSFLLRNKGIYLRKLVGGLEQEGTWGSFSDLLGASTAENGIGGWAHQFGTGHGAEYYEGMWKGFFQGTEAFANLTAMEMERARNKLWDEVVKAFMPSYSKWYDDILNALNEAL